MLHDQTVRLMNHGCKAAEIAEHLTLPDGLSQRWHNRGYYGTVSHNVKAIVQRYLSWYDAHPANLHALPPVPAARKTIEYMGGIDAVMQRAREDFERGEYRWVAEVMRHAVHAHPQHVEARELAAQALEQMGFQAESATWRNAYLLGAREYREGPPRAMPVGASLGHLDVLGGEALFDTLAVRVNASRAAGVDFTMDWTFDDPLERWRVELSNGALHARRVDSAPRADVALRLSRATLHRILRAELAAAEAVANGDVQVQGDAGLFTRFLDLLDAFAVNYAVVDSVPWPDR